MIDRHESEDALVEYMANAYMNETAKRAVAVLEERVRLLEDIIAEAQTILWKLGITASGTTAYSRVMAVLERGLKK